MDVRDERHRWPDHVHILASLRAKTAPADAVRDIKANSSGWVRQEFADRSQFAWQTGYGAFSVSASNVEDADLLDDKDNLSYDRQKTVCLNGGCGDKKFFATH
jgi:hypothetical protein